MAATFVSTLLSAPAVAVGNGALSNSSVCGASVSGLPALSAWTTTRASTIEARGGKKINPRRPFGKRGVYARGRTGLFAAGAFNQQSRELSMGQAEFLFRSSNLNGDTPQGKGLFATGLAEDGMRTGLPVVGKHGAQTIRAAKKGAPAIMPAVLTPSGPTDLTTLLLRNRIIFVGSPVNAQVAQRVISQLLTLAAIDENEEIKMYINCPGGSTYSVLAIYDTMAWIKPKVSTVCFGIAASQGALLLAGGEKGRRFAMPNARIMIHQPQGGCGGTADDVRRQVNEIMQSRDKLDKMFVAFTGQPLERVQHFTDRDRFFSASEAMEFGLIDGLLETEY